MTLTPERIAEIEAWVTGAVPTHSDALSLDDILHLCRLARLGLRVEGAPKGTVMSCAWEPKLGRMRCEVIVSRSDAGMPVVAGYTGLPVAIVQLNQ